jgi:hypothetical protein
LSHYKDRRLAVEAQVLQSLGATDLEPDVLHEVSTSFGEAIQAALRLGDVDLLSDHIEWMEHRDGHHQMWVGALQAVMKTYREATADQLDDRGALIVDWLNERAGTEA